MSTNVDKTLHSMPKGPEQEAMDDPNEGIEVEVLMPGEEETGTEEAAPSVPGFGDNLAETIDAGKLGTISADLLRDIQDDLTSRSEWEKTMKEGLELLGLKYEDRTDPWDGACGVTYPLITEAVIRFQSEAVMETLPAAGPVRTKIIGEETPEKKDAARRVEADMNHQITDEMPEYRLEHERMLWSLPAAGSAFKKVYYDGNLGRQTAVFVPAEEIILPYGANDLNVCPRLTHQMRKTDNEMKKLIASGFYREVALSLPTPDTNALKEAKDKEVGVTDLNDDRYTLYEVHVELDLEIDADKKPAGVELPYVVTMTKDTGTILSIRRNWEENDELKLKRQHFVHYQYVPGFGAYGFGLFHIIGGFAKASTSIVRQLVDAGTLSNLPGGLKSKGLRVKGDDTPIAPGEFRDVEVASGTIKDNIVPLPYKEPSAVLNALLEKIVDEGRRLAASGDIQISDMSAQTPVGTTLAVLERQLKVMGAIQSRLHDALKRELKLLAKIMRDHTDPNYSYQPEPGKNLRPRARQTDYSIVDIIPVSDPNASTMAQRIIQYQAVIQLAQMAPDIYDLPHLHRGMLEVLDIKDREKLIPLPEDMKPRDPVSENMAILQLQPVKAFRNQNHEAHLIVHQAMVNDPLIQQAVGQNPQAQQLLGAIMSHIAEHTAQAYRQRIEAQLGFAMPDDDDDLDPQVEFQLSQAQAQAAQQVLMQDQQHAAAAAAQQQAQDPVLQLQQQELALKDKEAATKEKKVQGDLVLRAAELALKEKQAGQTGALDTAKATVDALHKGATLAHQRRTADQQHALATRQAEQQAAKPAAKKE